MNKSHSSKGTALVTGASRRIGKAVCLHLANLGYNIALHYNKSKKDSQKLQNEIQNKGVECNLFLCDLTNEKQITEFIHKVYRKFPDLNILINNASSFNKSKLKSEKISLFKENIKIHLIAPFIFTRDFAKKVKKGIIINILDTNITKNSTEYFSYLLSKKALAELTKLSAIELAPHIRVNGIAPGLILAPTRAKKGHLKKRSKNVPLKRIGSIKDITNTLQFLMETDYITGQIIFNDGGEHLL